MGSEVTLVGLDFGSTTTSAVFARATLARARHEVELRDVRETFRSDIVLTPFDGELLDEAEIAALLDGWLAASGAAAEEIFGGGAIVTGLAARRANAGAIARLVRARLRDAVIATAEDPLLESWLAFMGSAAALSRASPETPILNLDIGGGTTNLALGQAGEVTRTSALFVGARHFQVEPGTHRLVRLSEHAAELLARLRIAKGPGDSLAEAEIAAVLDDQVSRLEAAVTEMSVPGAALCFSGGVGELVYARRRGDPPLPPGHYGDLGGELAARIVASEVLSRRVLVPASAGRATSYGLLRHSTQVSGTTLFLPSPEVLPLVDVPIFGHVSPASTDEHIAHLVAMAAQSATGGCVGVALDGAFASSVRDLGQRLARALDGAAFPAERPLVLVTSENAGKALGGYATGWGRHARRLVVVDQIRIDPSAHFVQIGRLRDQVVPVSFHGMTPGGPAP
jgi:ethanolamine utilization protein EutA